MKDLSEEPAFRPKMKLQFGSESGSDEKSAHKTMPMTVSACASRSDPTLSEGKRAELEAAIQAEKSHQKKERKDAKAEDKANRAEKTDSERKKPSTKPVRPKMTAAKKAATKKKVQAQNEDEESHTLDSEESPTSEELPSEPDDDGDAAETEPKAGPSSRYIYFNPSPKISKFISTKHTRISLRKA